jgi:hypothetical protein
MKIFNAELGDGATQPRTYEGGITCEAQTKFRARAVEHLRSTLLHPLLRLRNIPPAPGIAAGTRADLRRRNDGQAGKNRENIIGENCRHPVIITLVGGEH